MNLEAFLAIQRMDTELLLDTFRTLAAQGAPPDLLSAIQAELKLRTNGPKRGPNSGARRGPYQSRAGGKPPKEK